MSRTASTSTTCSTQFHTVQHKSHSLSPKKNTQEAPEWKRRLLHGEVAYGEQCDLFSPAGLESMFRPPVSQSTSPMKLAQKAREDSVMPSSPPVYKTRQYIPQESSPRSDGGDAAEESQQTNQQPKGIQYKMTEPGSDFTADDLSRSSTFRPTAPIFVPIRGGFLSSDGPSRRDSSLLDVDGGRDRAASGQSDIRNEGLSPIYVTRQDGSSKGVINQPIPPLQADDLKRRLEDIREDSFERSIGEDKGSPIHSPVDNTEGTDDYAHNGNFINTRRGGYSEENSFQHQMLSPTSAINESSMLPDQSMQASTPKELPMIKKNRASNEFHETPIPEESIVEPQTPERSPRKTADKDQQSSAGSPLKLFGAYDTFTNQKLLRRLSQFEDAIDRKIDNGTFSEGIPKINPRSNNNSTASSNAPQLSRKARKFQSFGEGDLDDFQFDQSYRSSGSDDDREDEKDMTLPPLNPQGKSDFHFQLEPSPALPSKVLHYHKSVSKQVISVRRGARPRTSSSSSSGLPATQRQEDLQTPRKRNGTSVGKRLQKTPQRDLLSKRRRTLQSGEWLFVGASDEESKLDPPRKTHQQMQSMIDTRSRDLSRSNEEQQATNPAILAMRQILRPRTPTPSQRSSDQSSRSSLSGIQLELDNRAKTQQKKLAQIQAELDFSGHPATSKQQMQNGGRKGSVTTQDFLDEAKKIMAGIRGKVRPHSGLASLEESESEHDRNQSTTTEAQDDEDEDSYQESTLEPFSRPPSRDGGPLTRLPLAQENPDLLDHLRKYQEISDIDGVVASSVRSMALAKQALVDAKELDRSIDQTISRKRSQSTLSSTSVSDPPNIRISENPEALRKRKHSSSSSRTGEDINDADFPTHNSNSSGGQSTMQSIPTRSSRGSESRRVIAPHTVSHLIPEAVAGMVFDRERNIWVKRKSSGEGQNFLPSDETEEDPFGDIPDLSINETQELQRVKAVAAKRVEEARVEKLEVERDSSKRETNVQHEMLKLPIRIPQIIIDESMVMENAPHTSPTRRILTNIAPMKKEQTSAVVQGTIHRTTTHTDTKDAVIEEVEREISIYEGRELDTPVQKRRTTITFSSPVESSVQYTEHDESSFISEAQDEQASNNGSADEASNGSVIINKPVNETSSSTRMKSALKSTSRRSSLPGAAFIRRPVSRIEERDEESYYENERRRSVSIIVTTPIVSRRISSLMLATPRPSHEIGTLTLTPMSDFTMHQKDETLGLDVSYVAQNQRYIIGASAKRTLSLSIKQLVDSITSVEPYEPYWENMKELSLREKKLTNLHKLDEFCTEVEDLDASHNQVSQLDGVPQTVRYLRVTHNILSDLTAWGHLQNLQYVDVSNNELDSLSAFGSLIHLRSLRADNNKIRSLHGVNRLDGLLSLRLRGNSVQSLDFSGTGLQRLTELDLKDNHVSSVANLQELRSLTSLNLIDNHLCEFIIENTETIWSLRYLKLSGNNLESIDVSSFPNLRLLYLDQNRLGKVTGLLKTKHLDSLSMREQHEDCVIDQSFLAEAFEIRKLFLSGNLLGTFAPKTYFLNLQYLELANCGIQSLPENFGYLVANVRVLNLNYNALVDLSPLEGIVRLKKLFVAGNRLRFLKDTAQALSLMPGIALADLRGNPLTVGFYPPASEAPLVVKDEADAEPRLMEPYTLVEADPVKVARYATCLDMQTRMLKRTYEMLVLTGCRRLLVLDGMKVDRVAARKRDKVWEELVGIGIFNAEAFGSESGDIKEEQVGEQEQAQQQEQPVELEKPIEAEEERWHAEDSFA